MKTKKPVMMAMLASSATVSMTLLTPVPRGLSRLAKPWGGEAPPAVGEVAGVDLSGPVEEQGGHHPEDHQEHHPGGPGVRAEEPGPAVLTGRGGVDPDTAEHAQRNTESNP